MEELLNAIKPYLEKIDKIGEIESLKEEIEGQKKEIEALKEELEGLKKDLKELGEAQKDSEALGEAQKDSEGLGSAQKDSEGLGEAPKDSEGLGEAQMDSEGLGETQRGSEVSEDSEETHLHASLHKEENPQPEEMPQQAYVEPKQETYVESVQQAYVESVQEVYDDETPTQQPWYGEAEETTSAVGTNFLPPIGSIREGMSLGDRFLFQRELFQGNGELMQQAIAYIDALNSFEEAMYFIQSNFAWWDTTSQAYEYFVNLLRRRFQV